MTIRNWGGQLPALARDHAMKPDATKHKPSAAYVRKLLERAGISQREAARIIGVTDRAMRFWCSDDPNAPRIPYTAQFALECLAAPD